MGILDFLDGGADEARDAANQGIYAGMAYMAPRYIQGRQALGKQYGAALDPFRDILRTANRGANHYAQALGLAGPQGQQAAYNRFMRTPGIQAGFDMGQQAIDRGAASRGMLGSGNTMIDLQKFATDYGSQKFGDYMSQLSPFLNQQMQAAQGMGAIRTGLGTQLNQSFQQQGDRGLQAHIGVGQNDAGAALAQGQVPLQLLNMGLNLGTRLMGMF